MTKRGRALWERLHPAWVGLVGLALYLRTVTYGFVLHDDPWLIRNNLLLHNLTLESVWRVLSDFSWEQRYRLGAEYLPVRDLSVMLDYAIYGDWVGGQHLTQVLLYAGTCAVLASLALALFENRLLAWSTGLLFAMHPVHVEVVAWLSERKGALGAFLGASSLLIATSYLRRGGRTRAFFAGLLFLLAVAAKALTIAGVGALALIMLWIDSPLERRRQLTFVAVYAACGLLVFVPNVWVSRSMGVIVPYHGEGFLDTLLLFSEAHGQYLKLMAYGGPYAIDYAVRPGGLGIARWLPGALAAALGLGAIAWALFDRSRRTPAMFGVGWWFVFLAPVSHVLVPVQNYAADRYLFLPSFGLLLSFSALLTKLPRRVGVPVGALVMLVGCGWTLMQTPVWSSTDRLFENAVLVDPSNADAWDKLASLAAERRDSGRAWALTRSGLEQSPGHWRLLHRQALLLAAEGKLDAAIEMMRQAASVPESHKAYANLALLYLKRGDRQEALHVAEEAVRLQPDTSHNQRVLGIVTYELGDRETACRAFVRAAALDPYDEDNVRNLEQCAQTRSETEAEP
ncbi:MAG: tetratricopeptide repeat protein [Polyangiales bacterium]|jgi:tetratricopeptide (TPR) repeat protein